MPQRDRGTGCAAYAVGIRLASAATFEISAPNHKIRRQRETAWYNRAHESTDRAAKPVEQLTGHACWWRNEHCAAFPCWLKPELDEQMSVRYTAVVTATGGRSGRARSEDGKLDLELSVPEEIGGPGGLGTNPEELFAAGYSGCFRSAISAVAARENVSTKDATVTAKVSLVQGEDRKFGLEVELIGNFPGIAREVGLALMRDAHEICPYSQATRGNIEVTLSVA